VIIAAPARWPNWSESDSRTADDSSSGSRAICPASLASEAI
jgi:hypothetical protein